MSRPVSTAAKLARGEHKADRLKANPNATGQPIKPQSLDAWGEQLWERIVPELCRLGVVSNIDGVALEELCHWYSRFKKLGDETIIDPQSIGASRIATQQKQCWEQFIKLAKDFGLTPVARNNVNAESVDDDGLKEFE